MKMRNPIISVENDFKNKVLAVVKKIPRGSVLSYGEVARLAGRPRAARAVGSIMKNNRDRGMPCHRVIRSDGKIGGYNGNLGEKRKLLVEEGYLKKQ